jgi:hypothetical protein
VTLRARVTLRDPHARCETARASDAARPHVIIMAWKWMIDDGAAPGAMSLRRKFRVF